jgi:hypothetical protein
MINVADQINVMTNSLLEKTQKTKTHSTNGVPMYKLRLEDLMNLGFKRSKLVEVGKQSGFRLTKKELFSFQSFNLYESIKQFLTESY